MKSPTLLVISQVYVPDSPSVGQHMHDAAAALARRGLRVLVMTSARGYDDPSQVFPARELRDGVEIVRFPFSSFGKKSLRHRLLGQLLFLFQVAIRGLFVSGLSGILVSTSPPMAAAAPIFIRFFRRVRIKYWAMDLNPDQMIEMGTIAETSLPARAFNALNRAVLKRADDVIALDRFMADRLNRKVDVSEKMSILAPWPHVGHQGSIPHANNPFRKTHGVEGKFVVMYSGNHGQTTPVQTLLDAAIAMQDRSDLVFMFIGGGVGKRDVERTISTHKPTNIIDLPYQPFDQIQYSLSAADLHVVTMGDNVVGVIHPCKVYGALALARPILLIGPMESHIGDLMRDQNIGLQASHGDVPAVVAAIDHFRTMPDSARQQIGDTAADLVNTRFRQSDMIEQFCDIVLRGMPRIACETA